MRNWLIAITAIPIIVFIILITACDLSKPSGDIDKQREQSVAQRADNFARALAKYPQPQQQNFPMREALVKYTQRQDLINHLWYIYVANECFQCPSGIAYQYYVGQTYPQSTCNFLGSTEDVKTYENDKGLAVTVVTAPSLDGIFYGGGGSKGGGCDYFFFDAATDAMQVIQHDWKWFVSDRILLLDAKLIKAQ